FIDLAPPGGNFVRLGSATAAQSFPYMVTTPGWHRFRGATADSTMNFDWELRYRPPGQNFFRDVPHDELRARVDGLDGAIVDGFEDPFVALHLLTGLVDKLHDLTFTSTPYRAQLGTVYSLRWSAQFLIDTPGDYRFRIETPHGHRAWINGSQVANTYGNASLMTTTPAMALTPGWHDVVIDAVKTSSATAGRFSFTVMDGPQFAGGGFPPDHLRPVAGRVARFRTGSNTGDLDMTDGMTVTQNVGLGLPSGIQPLALDSSVSLTHPLLPQVSVVLDPANGANVTLVAAGSLTGMGGHTQHDVVPVDRVGSSFNYIIGDATVDTMTGVLEWNSITVTYTGGRAPYESSFSYTSTVREIDAVRLGALSWQTRQSALTPLVSARTCDEAPACETETWAPVTNGETPTVPARKYFQYQVEMTTDGNVPASLDWIDLQYVGYVEP
ncbi:MAG: hypothetical protein ACKV2T_15340, partial [Kofleriaceae bacterium]